MTPPTNIPNLAMVMAVHNEEAFLEAHLCYHYALGVRRAYIFLDRCTDRSEEIVRTFPWVSAIPVDRIKNKAWITLFQNQCANQALQMARDEGFDWLLHLDPDEFAFGDNVVTEEKPTFLQRLFREHDSLLRQRGDLLQMLSGVDNEIVVVRLRTKEVLPTPINPGEPFWKLHFVQDKPLRRKLLNPMSGELTELNRFLGHRVGKTIVRTSADIQAFGPHNWTIKQNISSQSLPERRKISTVMRGFHYHFPILGEEGWIRKFKHQKGYALDLTNSERILHFPNNCWVEACQKQSPEKLLAYVRDWVLTSGPDAEQLVLQGDLEKDNTVDLLLQENRSAQTPSKFGSRFRDWLKYFIARSHKNYD